MKIGSIKISKDYPPLIIPEIGINHNGKIDVACKIVLSAKRAGAKIVKNQTHIANDEYSVEAKKIVPDNSKRNIFDLVKSCQLSIEDEFKLKKYTESLGMEYLSTPFSRQAVDRLIKLNIKAIKIGSGECNNYPLIKYICKFRKPIILSTGMCNISEISKTVNILKKNKIIFALNHCTNIYPADYAHARLNFIHTLKKKFPNNPIGLSDHSRDNLIALASIPMGVNMIERHYVDHKKRGGPDVSSSMNFRELKDLILKSRSIFSALKDKKEILIKEKSVAKFAFASVVSVKNIAKGEQLDYKNIWVKRPGTGHFLAKDYEKLIGKKAKNNICTNTQIKKSDVIN